MTFRERLSVVATSPWTRPHRIVAARFGWCATPDFLILGAQRAGTTSLYSYLVRHPSIRKATRKELQYFTLYRDRSWPWYLSHFPLRRPGAPRSFATGEASPYYLFHPDVPARVAERLPRALLIVLLRDPVERAFSHWRHERRQGMEARSFAEAIEACPELALGPAARAPDVLPADEIAFRHHSYLARGLYADQVERWLRFFPASQMVVLRSEDLYADPQGTADRVTDALGLPRAPLGPFGRHNETAAATMDEALRARLGAFFRPHSQRLAELTGLRVGDWT